MSWFAANFPSKFIASVNDERDRGGGYGLRDFQEQGTLKPHTAPVEKWNHPAAPSGCVAWRWCWWLMTVL